MRVQGFRVEVLKSSFQGFRASGLRALGLWSYAQHLLIQKLAVPPEVHANAAGQDHPTSWRAAGRWGAVLLVQGSGV